MVVRVRGSERGMGKDTVIVLSDGSKYKLTDKALNFVDGLKKWCADRGIPENKIPDMLAALERKDKEFFKKLQRDYP